MRKEKPKKKKQNQGFNEEFKPKRRKRLEKPREKYPKNWLSES